MLSNQKIKLLLSLSVFAVLLGCADELKKKEDPKDDKIVQLSNEQVTVKVIGLSQPNTYEVELSWPEAQGSVRVSGNSKMLGVVSGTDKMFKDLNVIGGSEITYLVEQLTPDGRISASLPVLVKVPVDLFWDGPIDLKEHQKIVAGRLFISNKTLVTTFDKSLTIFANEIIAEGGIIRNFPEGARAYFEKGGHTGGFISIVAEKASGSIQVNLNGEAGGPGRNGINYYISGHPGCAGTNGANGGSAGSLNVNIADGNSLNISVSNTPGGLGTAGVRGSVTTGPRSEAVYPPCDKYDPNGVDGLPGIKGQVCLKMAAGMDYVCN